MTVAEGTGTAKWVWRPRWTWWTTKRFRPTSRRRPSGRQTAIGRLRPIRVQSPSAFALIAVTLLILLATAIEDARALGFFELQILEIENYRGQLATGECCGAPSAATAGHRPNTPPPPLQCAGAPQCNTLFQVCLREYQSRQQQPASGAAAASASSVSAAAGGGRVGGDDDAVMGSNHHQPNSQLHHCSFGNVTSPVLGGNSFMLGGDAAVQAAADSSDVGGGNRGAASGNLALPFSFSWTRSFTFILQAMDYNNYTGALSVIEEATYSGILLPGNEWKALSHLGRTARMAYRVRVRCDRNYYGQTCTKLCKPRDDRFGHYTCGDTDGRKECIPGWQGETCDKAVCKTGCHPVHGKCDYPGGCECRKGWQGELCDQCMTYPGCKHGYCNGTSWQCICDVNWGGILCDQDLNYCGTHEPCLNGGTCKSTAPDQYTCTCPEGFGGANCDVVLNPCATEPCLNGGKCRTVDAVNIGGGGLNGGGSIGGGAVALSSSVQSPPLLVPKQFHCDCRPGWTGSTCNSEIDECATQPPRCLNGGSCVDLVADWKCVCPDDRWRGRRCEIDVDECERQRERQSAVADHHQCGPNAVPCKTTGGNSAVPSTECVCRRGWTTAAAAASASRDGNNNSTSLAASVGCTVNVDDCAGPDVKCANGGTCLDLIGGYACACPAGYTGRNCRTQIDPCGGDGEPGSVNPCKNGGECVPSRRWRNGNAAGTTPAKPQQQMYSCICQWGYTGENCEVDRDHCTPNPCRNGGHCLNTPDDYYCQCSGDGWAWHGKNCTEPTDTGVAGVSRTVSTTPTTVITTTTMSTTSVTRTPSPWTSPQPPLQRITPTISTVAAIRRPGATSQGTSTWRQQQPPQYEDEEKNKAPKVAVEEQHVGDGGAGVCSGRHRRKHWLADDGCNECKCSKPSTTDVDEKTAVSCTNLWCGPSAFDCLSDATCTGTNQVCVPVANDVDDEELLDEDPDKREYADGGGTSAVNSLLLWRQCLRPPCGGNSSGFDSQARDRYVNGDRDDGDDNNGDGGGGDDDDNDDDDDDDEDDGGGYVTVKHRTRGQCVTAVTDKDDTSTTVWPLAVRHCLPNDRHPSHQKHRRRRGDACGRLRVTLDAGRLRNGTRVSAVCHSLRRLLARAWVRNEDEDLSQEADEEEDRRNRMYVMCEAAAGEDGPRDSDNGGGNRGRRKRRVTIRVSVAVVPDKQQHQRRVIPTAMADDNDDDAASVIVGRSVQTLYKRLNGALSTMVAGSKKKAPMAGHRLRTTLNNNGDDNEDFAALEFLIAAVLDVTIGDGAPVVGSPSLTVPPSSSGSSNDGDYRQYYYYWTGGVACGALATVLAVAAFLLLRFRGGSRRKIGDQQAAAEAAAAAADASAIGGGDGLMLSLVRRQNEENLKRLQVTGGNRNSVPSSMAGVDYGGAGGCGRNNLSAGSSLSCSRVSIVHPLCNAAASVDDDSSSAMQLQCKLSNGVDGGAMDGDDKATGEKTNAPPAAAAAPAAPVAAVRSVAVAAARPQQRPAAVAAPRPILLCKKTLNVDHFQRRP